MDPQDEQDARITEALEDYRESATPWSYAELEAIFEDRDPTEFL